MNLRETMMLYIAPNVKRENKARLVNGDPLFLLVLSAFTMITFTKIEAVLINTDVLTLIMNVKMKMGSLFIFLASFGVVICFLRVLSLWMLQIV